MEEQEYDQVIKVIPHIKKYLKKNSWTGLLENENSYQFNYRFVSVKFVNDLYSWNRCLFINLEVSEKYWNYDTNTYSYGWTKTKWAFFTARRRNQIIRNYVYADAKSMCNLFSFPYYVKIGSIKIVE